MDDLPDYTVDCDDHGTMFYMHISKVYRCEDCGRFISLEEVIRLVLAPHPLDTPSPIPIVVT